MTAAELITESIPPLKTSDTGTVALRWMNEFHVTHLPIVNNQQLLGIISEEDIMDLNAADQPLGNHKLSLQRPFVMPGQHVYEIMKLISEMKITLVPVVDEQENYMGVITHESIIIRMAERTFIKEPGGILTLEIGVNDYSLAEIARIVESNNAIILRSYLKSLPDPARMEITLKINQTDLRHIVASFERFNYLVRATYQGAAGSDVLKDRYDAFMKYLDI